VKIKKPFIVYKTQLSANFWKWLVVLTVGLTNFLSIIQPALEGDMQTTIWSVAGPVIFSVVAWLMYRRYEKIHDIEKQKQKKIS
jgi:positive regulator of sigma E activity